MDADTYRLDDARSTHDARRRRVTAVRPAFGAPAAKQCAGSASLVSLVGAGPGDPELLTLAAVRRIEAADAIVYDRLVDPSILAFAPGARAFYVGKARNLHALPQDEINALLVRLAREGGRVVRLKGGDPFVFGRGGEEMEYLAAHGIPFEIVPGVSAANGIAAAACIPLTHRDHAQRLVFVTGHLKDGSMDLDWPSLAKPGQTLVVYMGLAALPIVCSELVRHGLAPDTAAAVVQSGTRQDQRVLTASLATLAERAAAAGMRSPALVVVGNVVRVREQVLASYAPARDAALCA